MNKMLRFIILLLIINTAQANSKAYCLGAGKTLNSQRNIESYGLLEVKISTDESFNYTLDYSFNKLFLGKTIVSEDKMGKKIEFIIKKDDTNYQVSTTLKNTRQDSFLESTLAVSMVDLDSNGHVIASLNLYKFSGILFCEPKQ